MLILFVVFFPSIYLFYLTNERGYIKLNKCASRTGHVFVFGCVSLRLKGLFSSASPL